MEATAQRRHEMLVGVRGFSASHSADFAAASVGAELFTSLADVIVQLDGHAVSQATGLGAAKEKTLGRGVARQAVRDALRAISRTAEAIAERTPSFVGKFPMPPVGSDEELLIAARTFVAQATPLSAQFISHELPADFLADLTSDIANLEAAISGHKDSVASHVSASEAIDQAISAGLKIVKQLDAIVRNKYANRPEVLAEWTSASHTERSPQSKTAATPTPPHTAGSGGAGGAPPAGT